MSLLLDLSLLLGARVYWVRGPIGREGPLGARVSWVRGPGEACDGQRDGCGRGRRCVCGSAECVQLTTHQFGRVDREALRVFAACGASRVLALLMRTGRAPCSRQWPSSLHHLLAGSASRRAGWAWPRGRAAGRSGGGLAGRSAGGSGGWSLAARAQGRRRGRERVLSRRETRSSHRLPRDRFALGGSRVGGWVWPSRRWSCWTPIQLK